MKSIINIILTMTGCLLYSGRFPQVGARFISAKNIFLPYALLNSLPETNPPCKTAPIVSKPAPNSPNCAYSTQFLLKKTE